MITEWRWLVENRTTRVPYNNLIGCISYITETTQTKRLQQRTVTEVVKVVGRVTEATYRYSEWQDVPEVVVELTDE